MTEPHRGYTTFAAPHGGYYVTEVGNHEVLFTGTADECASFVVGRFQTQLAEGHEPTSGEDTMLNELSTIVERRYAQ